MAEKICVACELTKPLSEFYAHKRNKDRVQARCKSCYIAQVGQAAKRNPRSRLAAVLKHHYNMTLDHWDGLMEDQGGVCAICGGGPQAYRSRLDVDHCPSTLQIRGLLCGPCNRMLAQGRNSPETLRAGALYLEKVA